MDEPEDGSQSEPKPGVEKPRESGLARIRAERQRQLNAEPGVQTGRKLKAQFDKSLLIVLPFQMALAPVLVTLLGWWLDRRWGTFPWLTLAGLTLGLISAVRAVIAAIKEVSR